MKKLILMTCLALGISAASFAQGGGRTPQTPDQQLANLKTQVGDLKLTADQETKVMAIYKAAAASTDSLTKAGGDMRTGRQPIMMAQTTKLKAVLTPEQFAKIPPRGGRGGGGGGGTPPPPTR
jgi:protein CpxP